MAHVNKPESFKSNLTTPHTSLSKPARLEHGARPSGRSPPNIHERGRSVPGNDDARTNLLRNTTQIAKTREVCVNQASAKHVEPPPMEDACHEEASVTNVPAAHEERTQEWLQAQPHLQYVLSITKPNVTQIINRKSAYKEQNRNVEEARRAHHEANTQHQELVLGVFATPTKIATDRLKLKESYKRLAECQQRLHEQYDWFHQGYAWFLEELCAAVQHPTALEFCDDNRPDLDQQWDPQLPTKRELMRKKDRYSRRLARIESQITSLVKEAEQRNQAKPPMQLRPDQQDRLRLLYAQKNEQRAKFQQVTRAIEAREALRPTGDAQSVSVAMVETIDAETSKSSRLGTH